MTHASPKNDETLRGHRRASRIHQKLTGSIVREDNATACAPQAWLHAEIVGSDVLRLNGEVVLDLTLRGDDGRRIRDKIVLASRSTANLRRGQRRLSELCHAIGWLTVLCESEQLHGWHCRVQAPRGRALAYTAGPVLLALAEAEPMGSA